jgi:hypothetical protein
MLSLEWLSFCVPIKLGSGSGSATEPSAGVRADIWADLETEIPGDVGGFK